MRILYLHQYFTTPDIGGGIRSYEFGKRLTRKGYEVEYISGPIRDNYYQGLDKLMVDGMNVNVVGSKYSNEMGYRSRMKSFAAYALGAIKKGVKLKKPDVVFATSTPLTVAVPGMFLAKYFKVPFVFEVRDLWPEAPVQMGALNNKFIIKAMKKLEIKAYEKASHIIALSPGMKKGIVEAGINPRKITMVPNSSDIIIFSKPGENLEELAKKYGVENKKVVFYAGAISEANGLEIIIEAAKEVQKKEKNIHFILAGGGRSLEFLKNKKEKNKLKNITFTGRINKYEVANLYRISSVSLVLFKNLPILMTNSPNKFFDSLAAGKPVISNMSGWIEGLLKDYQAGIYVNPDDITGLSEAIVKICNDNKLQEKMSENALKLAKDKFDRDKLAEQLEDVLIKAVEGYS